mgnify:CR=1 FL=1
MIPLSILDLAFVADWGFDLGAMLHGLAHLWQ